jgi:hypothetical protein
VISSVSPKVRCCLTDRAQAASAAASAAPTFNLVQDLSPRSASLRIGSMQRLPAAQFLDSGRRQRDVGGGEAIPQLFYELQALWGAQPRNIDAGSAHGANIGNRNSTSNRGVGRPSRPSRRRVPETSDSRVARACSWSGFLQGDQDRGKGGDNPSRRGEPLAFLYPHG